MAIYEYLCPQCRVVFEVTRPMSKSNQPAKCPKCNAQGERLPSVFASTTDSNIKVPDKNAFRGNLGRDTLILGGQRLTKRRKLPKTKKRKLKIEQ